MTYAPPANLNNQLLKDTARLVNLYQQPRIRELINSLLDAGMRVTYQGRPLAVYGGVIVKTATGQPGIGEKYRQLFLKTRKSKDQFKTLLDNCYRDERKLGFLKQALEQNLPALPAKTLAKVTEEESTKDPAIKSRKMEEAVFRTGIKEFSAKSEVHPVPQQLPKERIQEILKTPPVSARTIPAQKEIKYVSKTHPEYSSTEELKRLDELTGIKQEPPRQLVDLSGQPERSVSLPEPEILTEATIDTELAQIKGFEIPPSKFRVFVSGVRPAVAAVVSHPVLKSLSSNGQITARKFISRHLPKLAGGAAGVAGGFLVAGPPGAIAGGAIGTVVGQKISEIGMSSSSGISTFPPFADSRLDELPEIDQGTLQDNYDTPPPPPVPEAGEEKGESSNRGLMLFPARTALIGVFLGLGLLAFFMILFGEEGGAFEGGPGTGGGPSPSPAVSPIITPPPLPQTYLSSCPVPNGEITCASYGPPYSGTGPGAWGGNCRVDSSGNGGHCNNFYQTDVGICNKRIGDNGELIRTAKSIDVTKAGGDSPGDPVKLPIIQGKQLKWFYNDMVWAGTDQFGNDFGYIRLFQSEQTPDGIWSIHFVHVSGVEPPLTPGQQLSSGDVGATMFALKTGGVHVHITVGRKVGDSKNNLQNYSPNWKFADREMGMCVK